MGLVVQRPEFFSFATYKLCEDRKTYKVSVPQFPSFNFFFFVPVVKKNNTQTEKCIIHRFTLNRLL